VKLRPADIGPTPDVFARPKVPQFTGVWWSLVSPQGMYSVATDSTATELGLGSMQPVSLEFSSERLDGLADRGGRGTAVFSARGNRQPDLARPDSNPRRP
jgi:hypothetical protein